jgi:hypothetical protein
MKNLLYFVAGLLLLSACHSSYNPARRNLKWIRGKWNHEFDSSYAYMFRMNDSLFSGGFYRKITEHQKYSGMDFPVDKSYSGNIDILFHDTSVSLRISAFPHENTLKPEKLSNNLAVFSSDKGYPQKVIYSRKRDSLFLTITDSGRTVYMPMKLTQEDKTTTNSSSTSGHRYYRRLRY